MDKSKGVWIGIVALIIVGALALWWIAVSEPISTFTGLPFGEARDTSGFGRGEGDTSGSTDRAGSGVVSVAENIAGASTFASWLESTGVAAQIKGAGPYTIFVPTDKAASSLKAGTFTNLSAAEKRRLVRYHVVAGRAIDVDAQKSGSITALSGDALNFHNDNNIPMVGSAIIIAEYKASNGIVYLVSGVLIPPQKAQ